MHGICNSELPAAKLVSVYKGVAVIVNHVRQSNRKMNDTGRNRANLDDNILLHIVQCNKNNQLTKLVPHNIR
jgi:hypothetical protein